MDDQNTEIVYEAMLKNWKSGILDLIFVFAAVAGWCQKSRNHKKARKNIAQNLHGHMDRAMWAFCPPKLKAVEVEESVTQEQKKQLQEPTSLFIILIIYVTTFLPQRKVIEYTRLYACLYKHVIQRKRFSL